MLAPTGQGALFPLGKQQPCQQLSEVPSTDTVLLWAKCKHAKLKKYDVTMLTILLFVLACEDLDL